MLSAAFPKIDSLMRNFAERSRVPGIAYGIVVDGRLAHLGTAGLRHLSSRSPVDSGTVFRIASMTKSFTALAILQLRDAGRLSLDDPAERYVPELVALRLPSTDSPRITIRHLLSHSAGFPEDNPWGDQQLAATDDEMAAMMRGGIPFSNTPGVAYEYSNYGFAILGRIVANVSGMPYSRYVSEHILQPLGMSATTLEARSVPPTRLARGYRLQDGAWLEEPGGLPGFGSLMRWLPEYGVGIVARDRKFNRGHPNIRRGPLPREDRRAGSNRTPGRPERSTQTGTLRVFRAETTTVVQPPCVGSDGWIWSCTSNSSGRTS